MLIQLPEENKNLIFGLFKKYQPNCSALWTYFNGILPGKTYVDNIAAPKKAICVLDMSWVYISDDSDFAWVEETLQEIIKNKWIQVVWNTKERPKTPLENNKKRVVIPRFEYTKRNQISEKPKIVELAPFSEKLLDQLIWKDFHISTYGSKEKFLNQTFGYYALENGKICSECEAAFIANGFTEIGIITDESKRQQGYAFAACVRTLEEIENRGLKPIWACDKENIASVKLAEKLGFINPLEYDFIFFPQG